MFKKFFFWLDIIPLIFTVVVLITNIKLLLLFRLFRFIRFWKVFDTFGDEIIKSILSKLMACVTRSRERRLIYVSMQLVFVWIFIISFKALVITYFIGGVFWIISFNTWDQYPTNFVDEFGFMDLNSF